MHEGHARRAQAWHHLGLLERELESGAHGLGGAGQHAALSAARACIKHILDMWATAKRSNRMTTGEASTLRGKRQFLLECAQGRVAGRNRSRSYSGNTTGEHAARGKPRPSLCAVVHQNHFNVLLGTPGEPCYQSHTYIHPPPFPLDMLHATHRDYTTPTPEVTQKFCDLPPRDGVRALREQCAGRCWRCRSSRPRPPPRPPPRACRWA